MKTNKWLYTVAFLIIGIGSVSQSAEARWRSDDPNCTGLHAPNIAADPEGFFEWWGGCIDDLAEPPRATQPPITCDRLDGKRISDASGRCWRIACISAFQWRLEPCIRMATIRPGIAELAITTSGFSATVSPLTGKPREVHVKPSQIKLIHLLRAAVAQTRLPSDDLLRIRPDFWSSLKGGTIKVTGTFTRS